MNEAFNGMIEALGDRVVSNNGTQAQARCPAHDDNEASLGVGIGDQPGCCVVRCLAGCPTSDVMAKVGKTMAHLFDDTYRGSSSLATVAKPATPAKPKKIHPTVEAAGKAMLWYVQKKKPDATLAATFLYHAADGKPFGVVFRFHHGAGKKCFGQAHATPTGGWINDTGDQLWPMFNLHELPATGTVTIHEGEKAAKAAEALGLIATTSKGGATAPSETDWSPLAGREVVIFPDNDKSGEGYADEVAGILAKLTPPAAVRVARVPGLPPKGDVADLPAGTDDELLDARDIVAAAVASAAAVSRPHDLVPAAAVAPLPDGAATIANPCTWNDTGLCRRLIEVGKGRIRFVADRRLWVRWTGKHWEDDTAGNEPQRVAKAAAQAVFDEMHGEGRTGQKLPTRYATFALNAFSRRSIDAAIALAKSEPAAEIKSAAFDADADLLNVGNGILDLRTRQLRPHDPAAMLTKLAGVDYDPAATCPRWLAFVEAVTCGDQALAGFLQRSFGLALSADQSEQRLWIHHGEGSNGKGTALAVLHRVFGTYAGPAPVEILLARRHDGDREIGVAKLAGKRLAFAQEADDGVRLSEATVKALTGSDPLTGRFLYQNNFEVMPTWHLHLAVNDRPSIRGTDHGIWRRVTLVPWLHTFGEAEKRPRAVVEAELLSEGPGILNWLLDGYHAWRTDGLRPPAAVTAATTDYRSESDSVRAWIADACIVEAGAESPASDLFVAYRDWCRRAGDRGVSQTKFGRTLDAIGHGKDRPKSGANRDRTVRIGLRLAGHRQLDDDRWYEDDQATAKGGRF
jgi:putative DNA primase/helicase